MTALPPGGAVTHHATYSAPAEDAHGAHRINMSWLVRLRWAAILGQAAVIAYVQWSLHIALPLVPLGVILLVELVANVGIQTWLRTRPRVSEPLVAAAIALDVSCFTSLLYFTGGPFNPFSFLYLVYIAMAALIMRPRWTFPLVLFSIAASAALFARHVPLPMDHGMHAHHGMHGMREGMQGGEPLDVHLRGMWVAFAVAAGFIVYFINRMTRALADRETELARARDIAARSEKLASMATLAAGAAHELSSPLSTIAVVAKELLRTPLSERTAEDARLIREQVERCREILAQMAGGAGVSPGEMAADAPLSEIVRVALDGLRQPDRVTVEWAQGAEMGTTVVPLRATAQALRNVLKNAVDASPDGNGVVLRVACTPEACRFEVVDTGEGMSGEVLARAAEPFFTTKEPGNGMGLGLFLTRSVVGSLGGTLDIESATGKGTRVTVTLPGTPATNGRIAATGAP